jgi:hypothetical protein
MEWMKRHPYLTGGLILAVIVLFFLFRRRSSSTAVTGSTGPSEALQAANLSAQTQTQTAQLAAGVQQSQIAAAAEAHAGDVQAALAAKQLDTAAQVQLATIAGQSYLSALTIQGKTATDVASLEAQGNIAGAQYAFQTAQVQQGGQVQIAGINAGAAVSVAGIQAELESHKADVALSAQQSMDAAKLGLARIQSTTDIHGIDAATSVAFHQADIAYKINATNNQTARLANVNLTAVQKLAINTQGSVAKTAIGASRDVELANAGNVATYLGNQTKIADLLKSGGLGNKNRATVATQFFPGGGSTGPAIQYGGAATTSGIWAGISNVVGSVFGGPAASKYGVGGQFIP